MEPRSAQLHERACAVIPGGVSSAQRSIAGIEGLIIESTGGAYFHDADGKRYLDFHAAFGPQVLGHADPDVDRAFFETARRVDLMGVGVSEQEIVLAEKIVDLVPSVERVFFTSTGSEATFFALRLARAATGRQKVIKFQGCYHGWHDAVAMNVISLGRARREHAIRSVSACPRSVVEATLVCRFNDVDDVEQRSELHEGEIAAHDRRADSAQHRLRCCRDAGFLARLRDDLRREGIVLIFDEVITGFRHGLGGYQADLRRDARPDHPGQGHGQRLPDRRARRAGSDLMERIQPSPRRASALRRRHLQRARRGGRGRAGDDRGARGRAGAAGTIFRWASGCASGCAGSAERGWHSGGGRRGTDRCWSRASWRGR